MQKSKKTLIDKLEPLMDAGSWEAVAVCEEENKSTYTSFVELVAVLKRYNPKLLGEFNKLEDLFVQNTLPVKTAYKMGFVDGLRLNQLIWKEERSEEDAPDAL